ncbi:hypothetical protein C8R44DRAFT_748894 [Mycena epipterygia]|nr:hypothetical protein C8R44DRAFT_748894 [Mycena epipterygia]
MVRKRKNKAPGHISSFQGEKLEWLTTFEHDFQTCDRTQFYDDISKNFLVRYGYDLPFDNNVEGDIDDWVLVDRKAGLSKEELEVENNFQVEVRKELRVKLSNWYRHRFNRKRLHSGALKMILKIWGQFDHAGFTAAEASLTRYSCTFFSKETCRKCAWPPTEAVAPDLGGLITMGPSSSTAPIVNSPTIAAANIIPAVVTTPSVSPTVVVAPAIAPIVASVVAAPPVIPHIVAAPTVVVTTTQETRNWGPRWAQLIDAVVLFEESMYHTDGRLRAAPLVRPDEIGQWMKEHRSPSDYPVGVQFGEKEFSQRMMKWWRDIGPRGRRGERPEDFPPDQEWPSQIASDYSWVEWCGVRAAGAVIVNESASKGLGEGEAALAKNEQWQYMFDDILWVLGCITDEMGEDERKDWEEERAAEAMKELRGGGGEESVGGKAKGRKGKEKEKEKEVADKPAARKCAAPKAAPKKATVKKAAKKVKETGKGSSKRLRNSMSTVPGDIDMPPAPPNASQQAPQAPEEVTQSSSQASKLPTAPEESEDPFAPDFEPFAKGELSAEELEEMMADPDAAEDNDKEREPEAEE